MCWYCKNLHRKAVHMYMHAGKSCSQPLPPPASITCTEKVTFHIASDLIVKLGVGEGRNKAIVIHASNKIFNTLKTTFQDVLTTIRNLIREQHYQFSATCYKASPSVQIQLSIILVT